MARSIGQVNATLTLDKSQFSSANKEAQAESTATERALTEAAKRTTAAQTTAAKYAAEVVTEQGRKIREAREQEKQAGRDIAQLSNALKRGYLDEAQGSEAITAAIQRQIAARRTLAALQKVEGAGHGISDKIAASGTIMALEGKSGRRTIEAFTTMIPGASAAMQSLFPIIGGLGLAGLFFEMGEKAVEAFQKVNHATEATRAAFEDAHQKAQITIDDKAIENSKIQDQIDKLSKHPNNGLQTALLEASKAADTLITRLMDSRKQLDALLKEHDTGFIGKTLSALALGPTSTAKQSEEMLADADKLKRGVQAARRVLNEELAKAPDQAAQKAAVAKFNAGVHGIFQGQIDGYTREDARLAKEERDSAAELDQAAQSGGGDFGGGSYKAVDNGQRRANIQGRTDDLQSLLTEQMLDESIYAGRQKLGRLEEHKNDGKGANKAAEARLREAEAELAQKKIDGEVTVKQEYDFWADLRGTFAAGSTQYNTVVERQAALATEGARKAAELIKQQRERTKRAEAQDFAETTQAQRAAEATVARVTKEAQERAKSVDQRADGRRELEATQSRNATGLEEQRIHDEIGKSITRQDAALQLATLHTRMYGEEMDRLNAKAAEIASASYLTADQKQEQLGKLRIEAENLNGRRAKEIQKDKVDSPQTSAAVGAKDALNEMADAARDSAGQMREWIGATQASLNQAILHGNFKGAGQSILGNAEGALLNKAEGRVLEAFRLGKQNAPKGTAGDPMHVRVVNPQVPGLTNSNKPVSESMSSGALSGILGMISGGGEGGGAMSTIGSIAGMVLPGFATGGYVSAGTMAMVGEHGPEPVFFGDQARVMSNSDMRAAVGGGAAGHTIHVDARGSTDPAQTAALVRAGIVQMMPQIARASADHYRSDNRRNGPANRR